MVIQYQMVSPQNTQTNNVIRTVTGCIEKYLCTYVDICNDNWCKKETMNLKERKEAYTQKVWRKTRKKETI